ncbi:DmsE family decaheme c-type cytochrome [Lentisalinibacter sediminis]|uniref:DmsE family decaheme c-type cytochrome n=1 Tax=Lentisalinibacter sediminis TaxID=2992237 RepID=UPI00386C0D78
MKASILIRLAVLGTVLAFPSLSSAQDEAGAEPEYSRDGADTCLRCHRDQETLGVFRTPHGVPTDERSPFGHNQLQCEACHGPGGEHTGRVRRGDPRPPVVYFGSDEKAAPVEKQNAMCLGCHESTVPVTWHGTPHDANEVACADCHSSHKPNDPVLATSSQAQVCYDCHRTQEIAAMKPYSHPVDEGKMDCSSCHSPHGTTAELQMARQSVNDTCWQCHAETRGPFIWEHAPVSEDCTNCHEPHGSSHPGMLSLRGPMLCQSCHSQAGHPSVTSTPDGLPGGTPSRLLLGQNCLNCHTQVHGSNHPSGSKLMR